MIFLPGMSTDKTEPVVNHSAPGFRGVANPAITASFSLVYSSAEPAANHSAGETIYAPPK